MPYRPVFALPVAALLSVLLGALVAGCGTDPHDRWGLHEIPEPVGLDEFDPGVQRGYARHRRAVDSLLALPDAPPETLARAYGTLGMWHHLYDFRETALRAYANAHRLDAGDFRWPYYRAHVHRENGALDSARAAFETVLALEPGFRPARLWLGEVELEDQRLGAARRLFAGVRDEDSTIASAHLGLGKVALAEQRPAEAVAHLEAAARLQPQATEIQHTLGLAYRGIGDLDRAERLLQVALVDNRMLRLVAIPGDPLRDLEALHSDARYFARRGQLLLSAGRFREAEAEFRRAIEAEPDGASGWLNLGITRLRQGRPAEALTAFEEVLRLDPGYPEGLYARGSARAALGQISEAEQDYRAALARDSTHAGAHLTLADLLRQTGRGLQAAEHYAAASRIDPGDARARFWRAVSYTTAGMFREALEAVERDLEETGSDPSLRLLQIRLLATAPDGAVRDGARALRLARAAHREMPILPFAESVAMALAELGDLQGAQAWQRAAITAADAAGQADAAAWARHRLERYRAGVPLRRVMAEGERLIALPVPAPAGAR